MILLRSTFITSYMIFLLFTSIYAGTQLFSNALLPLSWAGLLLAAMAPLAFFVLNQLLPASSLFKAAVGFSAFCGLGLAITMTVSWRYGNSAGAVHIWAALCLFCWFAYLKWYSIFDPPGKHALCTGDSLPKFTLLDETGKAVHSSEFQGSLHIFVFIRGNWCPYCVGQVQELADSLQRINALGGKLILISQQPVRRNRFLSNRLSTHLQILSDQNSKAAELMHIKLPWGLPFGLQAFGFDSNTSQPATIIIDRNQKIIWAEYAQNYRERPAPDTLIEVLEKYINTHG